MKINRISDRLRASGATIPGARLVADASLFIPLIIVCHWFVISALAGQWWDDPNYTHGFFVLPMALVLAWKRRKKLAEIAPEPSPIGVLVVIAGGLLYLTGVLAAELFTMRVSLVIVVVGVTLATQGMKRTRVLLFPCLFLLLMVPIPYIFYYKMTFPMQLKSSELTAGVLSALGMPVIRSGNVINLENYTLEVVTACSGLRSIMTLGTLAIFFQDFLRIGNVARLVFVALVVPVAILANTVRLVTTAVVAAVADPDKADSYLHEVSGITVFLVGLALLLAAGGLMEWIARRASAGQRR
jgi:exosortase